MSRNPALQRFDEVGLDDHFYAMVAAWPAGASDLTEREVVAIESAQGFCRDPEELRSNTELWRRANRYFSVGELVRLVLALAVFLGLGQFNVVLGVGS